MKHRLLVCVQPDAPTDIQSYFNVGKNDAFGLNAANCQDFGMELNSYSGPPLKK